jgi:CHAT domain-containing protein
MATLVVAAVGAVIWQQQRRPDSYEAAVKPLVEALGEHRPFGPRLAGGFSSGPLKRPLRGNAALADAAASRLIAAAAAVKKNADAAPSIERRRALAVAELLVGEPLAAVKSLEDLVDEQPDNASLQSDLAGAYLVTADDRAENYVKALNVSLRALATLPPIPEAVFNKALAFEALGLVAQAEDTWRAISNSGDGPDWRGEASRRAEILRRRKSHEQPTVSPYERVEDHLRNTSLSDPEWLDRLNVLASDAARFARDPEIAKLARLPNGMTARGWRRIHQSYGAARADYAALRWQRALRGFEGFFKAGESGASPMTAWARLYASILETRIGIKDAGYRTLSAFTQPHFPPAIRGRARWTLGLVALEGGRYGDALDHFQRALADYREAHDDDSEAIVEAQRGGVFDRLGRLPLAWRSMADALRRTSHTSPRRSTLLVRAAEMAANARLVHAAGAIASEASASAQTHGPEDRAVVEWTLARIAALEGRNAEASRRAVAAIARAQEVADLALRERLLAEIALVAAELAGRGIVPDLPRDLTHRNFDPVKEPIREILLRVARGVALEREGAAERGAREHLQAVSLLDATSSPGSVGWSLAASVVETPYRRLIEGAFERGDHWEALALVERMRALRRKGRRKPLSGSDLERLVRTWSNPHPVWVMLPLEKRLLRWRVAPGRVVASATSVDRAELARLVRRFESALRVSEMPVARQLGLELSRLLFPPSAFELEGALLVAPNGPLARVAFAAIPAGGSAFLVDKASIAIVPSLIPRHTDHGGRAKGVAVLAPGTASRSPAEHLPAAAEEARGVSAAYSASRVLLGAEATPKASLAAIARFDTVHFAGHGSFNEEHPEASALWFADPERGATPVLIPSLKRELWSGIEVLYLSACSSARASESTGYEASSLAEQLLGLGVRAVVGSLWDVEDRPSAELGRRFHQTFSSARDPVAALRSAQLSAKGAAPAAAWSAYQVFVVKSRSGGPPARQR